LKGLLLLAVLGFSLLGAACQPPSPRELADLILLNGVVYTVDPAQPWAEAVGIKDGRILAVGSSMEIQALAGEETKVVNLQGALVLPGFIDAHTHFLKGGFSLADIQLRDAGSREEFIARIRARVDQIEKGDWILSGNWDHTQFDPPQLPAREWVDGFTSDTPVCVDRLDMHMVFANSRALELAGITKDTPTPVGGEIVKDPFTLSPESPRASSRTRP